MTLITTTEIIPRTRQPTSSPDVVQTAVLLLLLLGLSLVVFVAIGAACAKSLRMRARRSISGKVAPHTTSQASDYEALDPSSRGALEYLHAPHEQTSHGKDAAME